MTSQSFYSTQVIFFSGPGCPVNGDMLGVGPGTYNVPCSGRGKCINNRCICDAGWVGASDYFSLEGIDCHNPRYFEQVLWALTGFLWLKLMFDNWKILKYQREQYQFKVEKLKKSGKSTAQIDTWPVIFLTLTFLIGCPAVVITSILKVATNQIGGVDIPITFFFCIASTCVLVLASKSEVKLIYSLITPLAREEVVDRFIAKVQFFYYSTSLLYTIAVFTLNFLPIAQPHVFNGLDEYPRVAVVIAKNVVLLIYLTAVTIIFKITVDNAEKILKDQTNDERKLSKVNDVIQKLRDEHKGTIKKLVVGVILYGIFCIPQLWGYSTVPVAFLQLIAAGKTNVIYWYKPSGKAQSQHKATTDADHLSDTHSNKSMSGNAVAVIVPESPRGQSMARQASAEITVPSATDN